MSKTFKKAHGRSRFTQEQEEFVISNMEKKISEGLIKSSKAMKSQVLQLGKEYLQAGGNGKMVDNIGQTTMYNLLQRHNIPTFTKAKKCSKKRIVSEKENCKSECPEKMSFVTKDLQTTTIPQVNEENLLEKLKLHQDQVQKLIRELSLRRCAQLDPNFLVNSVEVTFKSEVTPYSQESEADDWNPIHFRGEEPPNFSSENFFSEFEDNYSC